MRWPVCWHQFQSANAEEPHSNTKQRLNSELELGLGQIYKATSNLE